MFNIKVINFRGLITFTGIFAYLPILLGKSENGQYKEQNLSTDFEHVKFWPNLAQFGPIWPRIPLKIKISITREQKGKVEGKNPEDYQILKRYDIIIVGGSEKLVAPINGGDASVQYYVKVDEVYDKLNDIHLAIGHGGRTQMLKEIQKKIQKYNS